MRTTLEREEQQTDTEITLGMTSLLGIFFGLVLICGIFFGLGYSLGRGSSAHTASAAAETDSSATSANHLPKPSADPAANQNAATSRRNTGAENSAPDEDTSSVTVPTDSDSGQTSAARTPAALPLSAAQPVPRPVLTATQTPAQNSAQARTAPAVPSANASAGPSSSVMVQIAAISRQEDADVLVSALKRKGYSATERSEPQDKLLHVQVGPFASRDEAKAIRAKLLADGYNAIVK
jgi:DedD protein